MYHGPQNEGYEDPSEHERRPRCQQRSPAPHGDQLGDVDVVDAALDAGPKTKEESRENIPRIEKIKIENLQDFFYQRISQSRVSIILPGCNCRRDVVHCS